MKKKLLYLVLTSLLVTNSLFAGSIRLKNNSHQKLRAIVNDSEGSHLGELLINSHQSKVWKDTDRHQANKPLQQGLGKKERYTISWHCMSGSLFSECSDITVGSLIMANSCPGSKKCKNNQKKGYPLSPEEFEEEENQ